MSEINHLCSQLKDLWLEEKSNLINEMCTDETHDMFHETLKDQIHRCHHCVDSVDEYIMDSLSKEQLEESHLRFIQKRCIFDATLIQINDDEFFAKEISCYNGLEIGHYVFTPSTQLNQLKEEWQTEAKFGINELHHIQWDDGFVPQTQVATIIEIILRDSKDVIVRSPNVKEFLQKFTPKPIHVFQDPSEVLKDVPTCHFHASKKTICTLSNVFKLFKYIESLLYDW